MIRALLKSSAIVFLALSGICSHVLAAAEAPRSAAAAIQPRADLPLLRETLRASGVTDQDRRQSYETAFQALLDDLVRQVGVTGSGYRRARRLHLALHQRILLRYESTADGLDTLLDRGDYNCLSASLLYGLVARAFGIEAQIVEIPRHVYVRLFIDGRRIEVESTSRTGFDLHPRPMLGGESVTGPGYGLDAGQVLAVPRPVAEAPEGVDLERAVGFLWHNAGRRALDQGEALRAARSLLEESRLIPSGAPPSEALGMYLARAFRMTYEAGNFDDAYRIAQIGTQIFPGQTTARDRLLAAALKRIEAGCDAGRPAESEEILDQTRTMVGSPADLRRLERGACPLIAAAAVRREDWERASRMARRFAAAELDGLESERLARWVAWRERDARGIRMENSCALPPPPFLEERPSPLFPNPQPEDSSPPGPVLPAPSGE